MQHNCLLNTLVLKTNKLRRLQEQVQKVDENKAVKRSVGTDKRFFIEELPDEAGQAAARDVMSVVCRTFVATTPTSLTSILHSRH